MLITGQMEDLDISQIGDCANISISVDRCIIWRPACWLSCTVTSARISQQQANLN